LMRLKDLGCRPAGPLILTIALLSYDNDLMTL
jgi:hypothetical protein